MKPHQVSRLLRRTATQVTLLDVLTSGNPKRLGRYLGNRLIGAVVRQVTRQFFMKGK